MRANRPRAVVALFVAAALTLAGSGAYAHFLGSKWAHSTYTYSIQLNGYPGYESPTVLAASEWANRTRFNPERQQGSGQVSIQMLGYRPNDFIAIGIPGPQVGGPATYTNGNIQVSAKWLNGPHVNCTQMSLNQCVYQSADDDFKKKCVIGHEMGHVMGLAHTEWGIGYRSLMHPDHGQVCHAWLLGGAVEHDVGDISALYPG